MSCDVKVFFLWFCICGNTSMLFCWKSLTTHFVKSGTTTTTLKCPHMSSERTHIWNGPTDFTTYSIEKEISTNLSKRERLAIINPQNDLKISNFSKEDAGLYRCLTTGNGTASMFEIEVILAESPRDMTIQNTTDLAILYENEGTDVFLNCNVIKGKPRGTLYWQSDGIVLANTSLDAITLNVEAVSTHHLKYYTCIAENNLYRINKTLQLFVRMLPLVNVQPRGNFNIREGEYLTITCSNKTNTSPTTSKWIFNNNIIAENQTTLHLINANLNSTGLYTCEVTNSVGKGADHVRITVQYKPIVIGNVDSYVFDAEIDQLTEVRFSVRSNSTPEISWTVTAGGKRGLWAIHEEGTELFIISSFIIPRIPNHLGEYGFNIRNEFGSRDITFNLVTKIVSVTPRDVTCNVSSSVTLMCIVLTKGSAKMNNTWSHEISKTFIRDIPGNVSTNVSTITIQYCDYRDSGKYICKWSVNSIKYAASSKLEVYDIPLLTSKRAWIAKNLLRFEVLFYSIPPPESIVWYRNDETITDCLPFGVTTTVVSVSFSGKLVMVPGFNASIFKEHTEHYINKTYSCKIVNSIGNLIVQFSEKDIETEPGRNNEELNTTNIVNQHLKASNIVLYIGGTVSIMLVLGLTAIYIYKNSNCTTRPVNEEHAMEQPEPRNSNIESNAGNADIVTVYHFNTLTPHDEHDVEETTEPNDNPYEEVEYHDVFNVQSNSSSPMFSSGSDVISDRSDVEESHSYQEIDDSKIDQHDYLTCVYNMSSSQ